jgi:hypothetical protein
MTRRSTRSNFVGSLALALSFALPLSVVSTLTASHADAFQAKHTRSGKVVRWQSASIELTISPSIDAVAPGARHALEIALEGWSHTPHAPKVVLKNGTASQKPGNDGTNLVYYAPEGFVPAGRALAVTLLTFDEATGQIVDADIVINGRRGLELLAASAEASPGAHPVSTEGGSQHDDEDAAFDLAHVFAHETGHALGLSDEPTNTAALMYPFTMPGDASHREPAADDAAGIAEAYAAPPPDTSTPPHAGCSVGSAPSKALPSGFPVAFSTVALLTIARLERGLRGPRGARGHSYRRNLRAS